MIRLFKFLKNRGKYKPITQINDEIDYIIKKHKLECEISRKSWKLLNKNGICAVSARNFFIIEDTFKEEHRQEYQKLKEWRSKNESTANNGATVE